MTTPSVGKVAIDAVLQGDDLHEQLRTQLTKEMQKHVLPQLKELNNEIAELTRGMEGVRGRPFEEMAAQAGVASKEIDKVNEAVRFASRGETTYRDQVLRTNKAIKDRATLASKARSEIREEGKVSMETQAALDLAAEKAAIAVERRNTMYAEWQARLQRIEAVRAEAQAKHAKAVEKARSEEIQGLKDLVRNHQLAMKDILSQAMDASKGELDAARKAADEQQKLREKATRDHERELQKQEKAEERSQRRRAKLARLRAKSGFTAPMGVVGEIGRALSGFAPRLSTGAFSTIATGALLVAGAVSSASQALWLLPAAASAAGAAIGTVALATSGFGDTIQALAEGDLEKFAEALYKLSPAAQQAALEIQAIFPQLQEFRNRVQETFFTGAAQMISGLTQQYLPVVDKLGVGIARAMNMAMQEAYKLLMTPEVATQINEIATQIVAFFDRLVPAVQPLMQAFLDITEVGASLLPGLANGAVGLAENFRDFIREAKESGKLREWLQRGLESVKQLTIFVWEVGRAFMSLAPVAEQVLPYIVAGMKGLADLLTEFPGAIYLITAAFITWATGKWFFSLTKNLVTLLAMLKLAFPEALTKLRSKMMLAFSKEHPAGLVGGLSSVDNGLDRTASKAQRLGGIMAGVGKALGGTALVVGGTMAIEDIISDNMRSSAALDTYRDAAQSARDAQLELNAALQASGGAWDENTRGAATSAIQTRLTELSTPKEAPSWLDQFRDDQGSLWGGFLDQITDFSGTQDSKAERMNVRADEMQQAMDLIKERFGSDMGELTDIVTGSQGGFDALIKNFEDLGPRGADAANYLKTVREEIVGVQADAAAAGPVLKRLGEDTAGSATRIKNAFDALPEDVPIKVTDVGGQEALDLLTQLGVQVAPDNLTGELRVVNAIPPEIEAALEALGIKLDRLEDGRLVVNVDQGSIDNANAQINGVRQNLSTLLLPPTGIPGLPGAPGGAPGTVPAPPPPGMPPALANGPLGTYLGSLTAPPAPPVIPPTPLPGVAPPVPPAPGTTGARPLPPPPEDPNAPSDSERKQAIEDSIDPRSFAIDPWAGLNAPNVASNGGLNVNVLNGMPPGMAGGITVPGTAVGRSLWDEVAKFESSGNWQNNDTGNNGHYGGLQFSPDTWRAFGGLEFAEMPHLATREQQIAVANRTAFTGYNGTKPQGLGAWEVITQGKVPGVNVNTPQSAFMPTSTSPMPVQLTGPLDLSGANNVSGLGQGQTTPGIDQLAALIAQRFPGVNLGGWRPSDGPNTPTGHQRGVALDIGIQDQATGDAINEFIRANAPALGVKSTIWRDQWKDFKGNQSTVGGHQDHVHVEGDGKPLQDFTQDMFSTFGPQIMNPATGAYGAFEVDQQALQQAARAVEEAGRDLSNSAYELAVAEKQRADNLISERDLMDKQEAHQKNIEKLDEARQNYLDEQRGTFKEAENVDYSKLPFGHPAKIMAGLIGGAGGSPEDIAAIVGPMFGNVGQPVGQFAGNVATGALGGLNLPYRQAPAASVDTLVRERNPLTPFAMAGYDVPDYTVQGGGPGAQNLMQNQGPTSDASGRVFSDTSALIDRSFSDLRSVFENKIDQLFAVMNEIKTQLTEEAVGPVIEQAVAGALEGAGESLGQTIGQTAGPIIADAVRSAITTAGTSGSSGAALVNTGVQGLAGAAAGFAGFAGGGAVYGGTPGKDSVPALLMPKEFVLDTKTVELMGGVAGVEAWRKQINKRGGVRKMATGGGVIANDTVGAEFFGVSQVPIIGAIVNLLVRVLLSVLGVEIEARDTLEELTGEFRQFRGEAWQAFTASGRLMNDTSALLDRSSTSEQAAADERVRILKIVIEEIIKFIIEKLIVPIGKAIANSLIQAGAGAASGAIGASFPGGSIVGGMVGNVITSAGGAATDIVAEIYTEFATSLTSVLTDMIAELIQGLFPSLVGDIFGGKGLAMLANPLGNLLGGLFGPILGFLGGIFGGASESVTPGFDSGGLALGEGMMPKATIEPERVLNPRQTRNHERLTELLDSGVLERIGNRRSVEVHAPIYLTGSAATAENVQNRLTRLID